MQPASGLRFRIALPHLVALNDQIGLPPAGQVAGGVAIDPFDPGPAQDLGGWRIGIFIGPGDIVAQLFGNQRQPGDGVAADADEVDAHQWRATPVIRSATSCAARGRPREPIAVTILLYRTGS